MNQLLDSYQIFKDITENWLDFVDLDLIVKVTTLEKLKIHDWGRGQGEMCVEGDIKNAIISSRVK